MFIFKKILSILGRYKNKTGNALGLAVFSNLLLIIFESASIILLPKVINIYETFEEYNQISFINLPLLTQNKFISFMLLIYFLILSFVFLFRILSLNLSANFANKISIEYMKDFAFSFSYQDLDGHRFLSKDEFTTYLQVKFPMTGREIFVPLTQVFSSLFLTLTIIMSIFFVNFKISLTIIIIIFFVFILISRKSAKKLKFFGTKIKEFLENQGKNSSDLYESLLLQIDNFKENKTKRFLLENDNLLKSFQKKTLLYTSLPKFTIEYIILVLLLFALAFRSSNSLINTNISILSTIIIALLKSISSIQLLSRSYYLLQQNYKNILDIEEKLNLFKTNLNYFYFNTLSSNIKKEILLKVSNLNLKKIGNSFNQNTPKISFELKNCDICLVEGKSGAGKSRFLSTLSGRLPPDTGSIYLRRDFIKEGQLSNIYLIPQQLIFIRGKIYEFLNYKNNEKNIFKKDLSKIAKLCCCEEKVFFKNISPDLDNFFERKLQSLSGGQYQRIAILGALLSNSNVILMDEGTSGMDEQQQKIYFNALINYIKNKSYSALIYTTHNNFTKSFANRSINL
tara:strand:- start:22091 stop:23797 length:1707 start_codon:yes stop_codon:yes gene_type:complete